MIRRLAVVFVVLAIVVVGVFWIRNRSSDSANQVEESVRRAEVERGKMVVSVTATGRIVPKAEARLSFDLPGKVEKVLVEVGDSVEKGDVLARLDDTNLAFNVRQAEAALAIAQAQLDQLKAGPRSEEVVVAQANLAAAEAGLDGSQANLRELENGPEEIQIAAAEANLRAAKASWWLATIQRDEIVSGASESEIAALEAQVASALVQQKIARDAHDQTLKCVAVSLPDGSEQRICPALGMIEEQARFNLYATDEAYEAAQAQLDRLLAGPTEAQTNTGDANVAIAAAQRDAAQAQLDMVQAGSNLAQLQAAQANVAVLAAQRDAAQAQLDLLLAGASVHQVTAAQASVNQAQVVQEMAQVELKKTVLSAPFSGLVTAINVQEGQATPANLPAVMLADMSELQIVVAVDEIDVARIHEGQDVVITVDALPEEVISGYVKRIAPAASEVGGVVVYEVIVVLDDSDLPLRVGMSAVAAITVEEIEDALLIPNWAIRIDRNSGKTFVNVLRANGVDEVEVVTGVRGEDVSQVLSGLREGDVVAAGDVIGLRTFLERED